MPARTRQNKLPPNEFKTLKLSRKNYIILHPLKKSGLGSKTKIICRSNSQIQNQIPFRSKSQSSNSIASNKSILKSNFD